ncbi:hypothetical protein C5C13_02575 [Clavibacter michiganensis]|nr:hypothetical protein C5C13_02575 [Clavibacter michiganensis]
MSPYRMTAVTVVALSLALAAAGCSSPTSGLGDLDRDPTTTDHPLPPDITDEALADVDRDSLRWVGAHEGADLWLGVGEPGYDACLVIYPDGTDWLVTCGGALMESSTSAGLKFAVVPDGGTVPAGFGAVSHNVFAAS